MKITKQNGREKKWGYYNWTNTKMIGNIKNPTIQVTLYLGKNWYHIVF